AETSYKSARMVKSEQPVKYVKQARPQPRRAAVPPPVEKDCCEEQEYAWVPVPLPQLPQAPIVTGGGGQPVIVGGSGGFGGGFGGGFFGGFFGGGGGSVSVSTTTSSSGSTS